MLRRQAKEVVGKRWITKHEYEELTDGVCVEPLQALPIRKTSQKRTVKHANVARKLIVEGGCTLQRLYDLGWSDEKMCKGCEREGTEKHR